MDWQRLNHTTTHGPSVYTHLERAQSPHTKHHFIALVCLSFRGPIFQTNALLSACRTSYHPNYQIDNLAAVRKYYSEVPIPDEIEASSHSYIDTPLLEFFATAKTFAWYFLWFRIILIRYGLTDGNFDRVSSTNCACLYNLSMAHKWSHITGQTAAYRDLREIPLSSPIQPKNVLNGFFIYSLLLDKAEHGQILLMNSNGELKNRLMEPLGMRNKDMEGTGQEAYTHACDKCFHTYEQNGKICMSPVLARSVFAHQF